MEKFCNFSENKERSDIKILQRQKLIKFSSQVAVKTFKLLLQTSQSKLDDGVGGEHTKMKNITTIVIHPKNSLYGYNTCVMLQLIW